MKLTNWDYANKRWNSETVAEGAERFQVIDRLGREVGASYRINREVFVVAGENTMYSSVERNPVLAGGPGTYYQATVWNTRNGLRYQSTTSVLCASQEAAQRYCDAYMTKKAKDAPKKAGK